MERRVFGKYEVLEEVGQGGMSVVYRGRDPVLGREVAIKVMHPFLATRADAKQRFYREAMAVAKLDHPNILKIFDYSGEAAEQAYIVTEFIRGDTLAAFAQRFTMKLPELGLLVMRTLGLALIHAHERGIIHRDLKPENVMIHESGSLKLMDFGIAQMVDADTLTTTGALLGSPAHMAPELIEGEPCDARADLFSMGTILYWLVTQRLPFTAPTAPALFKKIAEAQFDDPRMHSPLISSGTLRIIKRLLQKRPADRYQTVREAVADFDAELLRSGIANPEIALPLFLVDPPSYAQALTAALIERLERAGDDAAGRNDISGAIEAYDRLLGLKPDDARVRDKVLSLGRRQRRRQRLRRALKSAQLAAGGLVVLSGAVVLARHFGTDAGDFFAPAELSESKAPAFHLSTVTAKPAEPLAPAAGNREAPAAVAAPAKPRDVEFKFKPYGTLSIDGAVVAQEVTKTTQPVLPGKHRLKLENPFREAIEREIEIPPSGALLPIALEFDRWRPAEVRVLADAGAEVTLDGEVRGPAALSEKEPLRIPMVGGDRAVTVKVSKPGSADKITKLVVHAGQITEYDARH